VYEKKYNIFYDDFNCQNMIHNYKARVNFVRVSHNKEILNEKWE